MISRELKAHVPASLEVVTCGTYPRNSKTPNGATLAWLRTLYGEQIPHYYKIENFQLFQFSLFFNEWHRTMMHDDQVREFLTSGKLLKVE